MFAQTSVNGLRFLCGDFNARIQKRLPGEELYIGNYVFGKPDRELLLEFCAGNDIFVANTAFPHAVEQQATFRDVRTPHRQPVSAQGYAQLDLFLLR